MNAIVEVAVAAKKMLFRYNVLCGMTSEAADAVRSAIAFIGLKETAAFGLDNRPLIILAFLKQNAQKGHITF